jgi:hypothetical protein
MLNYPWHINSLPESFKSEAASKLPKPAALG